MTIVRKTMAQSRGLTRAEKARLDALTEKQINAAALSDPDNPPSTKKELARMAAIVRGRGRPAMKVEERKVRMTLRLPPEVVKFFRTKGPGWQSRISETLVEHVKRRRRTG